MTTFSTYALRDSRTMLRRNLRHMRRYPSLTVLILGMPVLFLLLFVYILGGTISAGLPGIGHGSRGAYANYLAPGIMVMTLAAVAQGTAINVAMDMTQGIIARFRTMAIFRPSILAGHVIGAVIQSFLGVLVVTGVAVLVGFRPTATPIDWLAAIGMMMLLAFALTWLTVALGLTASTVESASNLPMPLVLLPFLGSGFVPTGSMPAAVRAFAAHQPFTPIIETLRGLLLGGRIGTDGIVAVGWCVAISAAGFLWARSAFERPRA